MKTRVVILLVAILALPAIASAQPSVSPGYGRFVVGEPSKNYSVQVRTGSTSYSYNWGRWEWKEFCVRKKVLVPARVERSNQYHREWRVNILIVKYIPAHYEYRNVWYGQWVWTRNSNWQILYRNEYYKRQYEYHKHQSTLLRHNRGRTYTQQARQQPQMQHPSTVKRFENLPRSTKPANVPSHARKGIELKR